MNDGRVYDGNFENNKFEGKGKLTWPDDKMIYIGDFKNGKREGNGKITYSNGKEYDGQWKGGLEEGEGRQTSKGSTISGLWKAGKLQTSKA